MTRARILTVVGTAAAIALPAASGTAWADPRTGDVFTLTCAGTTYQVSGNGNGEFTPAHDLNSSKVFVPHAFQGFTGTIYDTSGNVFATFSDPSVQTQGSGKQKNDLSCTYTFTEVSDGSDPEGPPAGYTIVGSGGVTGQVSGH